MILPNEYKIKKYKTKIAHFYESKFMDGRLIELIDSKKQELCKMIINVYLKKSIDDEIMFIAKELNLTLFINDVGLMNENHTKFLTPLSLYTDDYI